MTYSNPTGEELEVANTNWLLMSQLAKAGGVAQTAISLLGHVQDTFAANRLLVKACRDVAKIVDLEQFKNKTEKGE